MKEAFIAIKRDHEEATYLSYNNSANVIFLQWIVLLLLVVSPSILPAQIIQPSYKIQTSGAITDFLIHGSEIIASTDAGTIETYQLSNKSLSSKIQLPQMLDFMGDPIPTKVYSIDHQNNNKLLAVTQGKLGFRNIILGKKDNFKTLIDANTDKMMIKKARFIDASTILFATLSNELVLFNILTKQVIYTLYISAYTFSDFSLSEDKQFVFTSDESGVVHQVDVMKGEIVKEFSGNNVDNVYVLDYKNNIIITAGQDRRVGIYKTKLDQQYYLQENFLVYCIGLNKDGSIGAFAASEESEIELFNTDTQMNLITLKGHTSTVTRIEFIDDNNLVTSADDKYLMFWKY